MSGTHTDLSSDPHAVYLPIYRVGQAEARLPGIVAVPFIAGMSWGLWMVVLQGWRVLSGL